FTSHANVSNKYMGIAKANIGEKMTQDDADDLTIELKPILDGSTHNNPYDSEGRLVKERILYENGICKSYWGNLQHSYYLQIEDTTSINNVVVCGGSMSIDEMRQGNYLEVSDFSAFIMDSVSGNFGGEIRLGYEKDETGLHPVVGGSISANFSNVLKNIKFSKETKQINNYIVPCAVLLSDVSVAGE
ncbi:MAG: metallopeptidase TldD-related protein, partial [Traorella sp.]